jgi:hypothetical protein
LILSIARSIKMNDREIRCLFNKYRRIDVTLINRFFHFCAFCAFARTSFHSTLFARLQTYLTKWCRESSFSSNSFDSDVMIMRLIKIFNVHDKQFMFKQKMSDKMIEWWKKKRIMIDWHHSLIRWHHSSNTLTFASHIRKESFVKQKSLHLLHARCTRNALEVLQHTSFVELLD